MTLVEPAHKHRAVRVVGAVVLAGHGLVHLMGVALPWRLGRPGGLRYEDVHPMAGSAAGLVVGGLWLGVSVLFVAPRRWSATTGSARGRPRCAGGCSACSR